MAKLIELRDVYKIYSEGLESEVRALDGVSLTIDRGEFVAIVGQSGSGKSTMMNVLGCLDVPTYGEYLLEGTDVSELSDMQLSRIRNKEIGFIFQQYNLIQSLSVQENVELPLVYQGIGIDDRHELAIEALERVGLVDRRRNKPTQMSGGQQQRVAIARAISTRPPIIMADEPTGALDSKTGHEVLQFLQQLNKEGSTVILITHDNGIAATARRCVRLADGKIVDDRQQEGDWLWRFLQAFKMAWRSIVGKKGRSALTILSIFIGIAAVMTIVSVMEGMKAQMMKQFSAMGANRVQVSIYSWMYDADGNDVSKDYFPDLYDYCQGLREYVIGITPNGQTNATVIYGTKNSSTMQMEYDKQWNLISGPPSLYYGSDQYSACNNLTVAKGRDLAYLDIQNYNQVCVIGAEMAKQFFGTVDPVGKTLKVNGNNFTVVGVYAARGDEGDNSMKQMDNMVVFPYTASRVLGGARFTEYIVKARDSESANTAIAYIGGFLKGLIPQGSGDYEVRAADYWQQYQNESFNMIGMVLGGIAAISLLVGGIGIMNIMLVTVTERTREIGIRRAIGAQRSSIVTQFLIEAGMLCGMGGIVGIIFGTIGSVVLGRIIYQQTIYPVPWVTIAAFALSVALGVLFGSYPAIKASKLQPVEALRAE